MRKVNISIDDVTPHQRSSISVIKNCVRILERVPSAKFTLFVPTAYWRTLPAPPESRCESPMYLWQYPDFCSQIAELPDHIFEVGYHGHHHGIPGVSNNDELKSVSREEALQIYDRMIFTARHAGLEKKFKRILRPPAWRLSPAAFDAAVGVFDLLALNPGKTYLDVYQGKQNDAAWQGKIVYQDAAPPIVEFPDEEWETLEIVTHACEWDKNYLSQSLADSIADLMIEKKAVGAFIGDLRGKI